MDLIGLYRDNELYVTEPLLMQPPAAVITTANGGTVQWNGAVPRGRLKLISGNTKNGKAEVDFPWLGAAVSGVVDDNSWRDVQWTFRGVRPENPLGQNISFAVGLRNEEGTVYACFRQANKNNYINFSVFKPTDEASVMATNIFTGGNGVYQTVSILRNYNNYTDFSVRVRGTTIYYGTFGGELGSILADHTDHIKLYPFVWVTAPYTGCTNRISIDEISVRCNLS